MFGKKKKAVAIPEVAVETFEQRKQALISRRKSSYEEALTHSADSAYNAYISACRERLQAAEAADDMPTLIREERRSNATYLRPRKGRR